MDNIVAVLVLLFATSSYAQLLLQGPVTVSSSDGTNGVKVRMIQVPSWDSTESSYPVDSSLLQSCAQSGKGTHRFFLDNSRECVASLNNSTVVSAVIQCEASPVDSSLLQSCTQSGKGTHRFFLDDSRECVASLNNSTVVSAVIQCEASDSYDHRCYDVTYPGREGCMPAYFQGGLSNGHIFYIGFAGSCIPLRVQVDTTTGEPARVSQEYWRDLSGKEVVVTKGENTFQEEAIFYAYVEDNQLVFQEDDLAVPISATEIGSCGTLTSLQPLPTAMNGPGLVVNCADSSGAALRYLVYFNAVDEALDHVVAVSEAGGVVRVSENGDFLAVIVNRQGVYSLVMYHVANILKTQMTISYAEPIHAWFLQNGNETRLVLYREGEDVVLVDPVLLTSTNGDEGQEDIAHTTILSCDPYPYADFVAPGFFMVAVWNSGRYQFDLQFTQTGSSTVSTIPQVSSEPPVFLFSRLEPIPASTGSMSTAVGVATNGTTTETPSTAGPGTLHTWVVALIVVSVVALATLVVLISAYVCYKKWYTKNLDAKKEEIKTRVHKQETTHQDPPTQDPPPLVIISVEESRPFAPIQVSQPTSVNSSPNQSPRPSPQLLSRHSMCETLP